MPEILQYGFMIRALLAGLIVALVLPLLGSFLVARRYSLIADSLSHVSLAGVGAGLLLGVSPVALAIPITVAGSLLLEYLRQKKKLSGETGLAVLMSGGLALAVVLAGLSHGGRSDFSSFLFGSITTTSWTDVMLLLAAALLAAVLVLKNYRPLLHIAFDEDSARITGYRVTALNYMLTGLTALLVVLSLRIVGGLLISALLVLPVISAARFNSRFRSTIVLGIGFAAIAVLGGLLAAFYLGIAAGGAIVLTALLLFCVSLFLKPE